MKKLSLLLLWVALLAVAPFVSNCSDPLELSPTGPELIDTIYATDTLTFLDTTELVDTLVFTDTITQGGDTIFIALDTLFDTIYVVDTVTLVDTVMTVDTIYATDTLLLGDTVYVTDTLELVDTVVVTDTVETGDTIYVTDTLNVGDTVYVTDTLTLTDTVIVVDTVFEQGPCPPDDVEFCSELDSHNKDIVWLLRNTAGFFKLEFHAEIERDHPPQTLEVNINGTVYTWTPAEYADLVLELDLPVDSRVEITTTPAPARGHGIGVCLDLIATVGP